MSSIQSIIKAYRPALTLERLISFRVRKILRTTLTLLLALILILLFVVGFSHQLFGLLLVIFSLWGTLFMLHSFFNSYYLEGLERILSEHTLKKQGLHDTRLEVAYILDVAQDKGLLQAFLDTVPGELVCLRAGISHDSLSTYGQTARNISPQKIGEHAYIDLKEIVSTLLREDKEFKDFIFSLGVTEKTLLGAAGWVDRTDRLHRENIREWGRDHLGRIPGIGKDWSYGRAYTLEKYGSYAENTLYYERTTRNEEEVEKEVRLLESVLARREEANAILIGDSLEELMHIIGRTAYHIAHGSILPVLQHKRIFILNLKNLITQNADKGKIEQELTRVMVEMEKAGNLILAIDDLGGALSSAQSFGVDILSIMDSFITSSDIAVVGTSLKNLYFGSLEHNQYIKERFEVIQTSRETREELVRDLEDIVPFYEKTYEVFVTYPALEEIARHAEEHFGYGILSDKVHDLLEEVVPYVLRQKRRLIQVSDIKELVEDKTGIPVTDIDNDERELLLNLEKRLSEYVVGQESALISLSKSLRRSRSNVNSSDRPIGSFLFLGPTGVGKTETTKSLARVLFNDKSALVRFDMSEYTGFDALPKLVGSFETGKPGVLVQRLRENPYGVVLLDEFEKTSSEVKDLFLQIFDEGSFKDMSGRTLFTRDSIFIATSNAVSDMVWDLVNAGENPVEHKEKIVDAIINEGLFKPELLNRFDDIIIFHPLEKSDLRSIAELMLRSLEERLYKEGVRIEYEDDVIDFIVEKGYDPQFGARPMKRAIQDTIEEYVARKRLEGNIERGTTLTLTREMLE